MKTIDNKDKFPFEIGDKVQFVLDNSSPVKILGWEPCQTKPGGCEDCVTGGYCFVGLGGFREVRFCVRSGGKFGGLSWRKVG